MLTKLPLVSIIIPSYNHAQYIAQAINSVLNQSYQNIELIIVDDGSQDDSHAIIKKYADDPRVTVILDSTNHGQSHAFNRALEQARGEFISLLPSDDWYLPRKTELQVNKFLESEPDVGVVYAAGNRFYEDLGETKRVQLPVYTGWILEKLITEGIFVYPVTPMFRSSVFERAPMHEGFKAEGEAVYLRIALHYKFEYVDEVVAVMRDHTYNIGKDVNVMYDQLTRYWDWFFERPELPLHIQKLKPVAIERMNRVKGMQFIGEKRNYAKGRQCLLLAIKINRALLLKPKIVGALMLCILPARVANSVLDALVRHNRAQVQR